MENMKRKMKFVPLFLAVALLVSVFGACAQADTAVTSSVNFSAVKAGDIITFGYYEQDNNLNNGSEPIEWIVLKRENDRAFLMSRYALDCRSYNLFKAGVTWETCSLRAWLNGSFYYQAFSADDRTRIIETNVEYEKDAVSGSKGRVRDNVYVLSYGEAVTYWSKFSEVKNWSATKYATENALSQGEKVYSYPEFYWWLRTPGARYGFNCADRADCVRQDGPNNYGHSVEHVNGAVRPVLWISLGQQTPANSWVNPYPSVPAAPSVPSNPTVPSSSVLYCPQCGRQVKADSKFCMYCGAKIEAPAVITFPQQSSAGSWSSWSTTPVSSSPTRNVETRSTVVGYNMVHYGTQTAASPHYRMFRSYSISGAFDAFGARSSYGEKHYTKYVTASQLESAKTYSEGIMIGGEYNGYQMGSGLAYKFSDDKYVWFIESPVSVTEYRYRDLY